MYRHINGIIATARYFVDKSQCLRPAVQRKGADAARTSCSRLGGGIDVYPIPGYIQKGRVYDSRCMTEKDSPPVGGIPSIDIYTLAPGAVMRGSGAGATHIGIGPDQQIIRLGVSRYSKEKY